MLNEADPIKSVLQNVYIILATRQGSVPLYREFGLSRRAVDKPIPVAKTMIIADIREALRFEPRAKILSITFSSDTNDPAKLVPIVEVDIADG